MSRRVLVRVEGRELAWMREAARRRGRAFLEGWAPYVGSPYRGKEEWDYTTHVSDLKLVRLCDVKGWISVTTERLCLIKQALMRP